MPSKRKNKKGKSSPKGRGRVTRKTNRAQITRIPSKQFYADGERVTLKYTDQYLIVGNTTGLIANLVYKLNSVYQVNSTAASGTPQGVASLAAKFKKVHVFGSRIHWRIRGLQPGGSFGSLGVLGVADTTSSMHSAALYPLQSNGSTVGTVANAAVQKYATRRFDWPRDMGAPGAASPEASIVNPRTIWQGTHSMTAAKLDSDPDPNQASYVSNLGAADPANIQYWVFAFQDVIADATGKKVWLSEVDLHYDILCFDRVTVADALLERPLAALQLEPASELKEPLTPSPSVSPFEKVPVAEHKEVSRPTPVRVTQLSLGVLGARR